MSIKLSADTIALLENYAGISKGVFLKPGKELKTINASRSAAVLATIVEEFPHDVPIHDIVNFLNALNLFTSPSIEFRESQRSMVISESEGDSKASVVFQYSAPEVLLKPPTGRAKMNGPRVTFKLTETQLASLVKATSVFKNLEWAVISDGTTIKITTYNAKNVNSNAYSIIVDGESNGVKCTTVFSTENIRLLKGNYDVVVTEQAGCFTNTDRAALGKELIYWIGVESTSKFNGSGATADSAGN